MNTTKNPNQETLKRKSIPLWVGFIAALVVWDVLPWAISLLSPRYGWTGSRPGLWNMLGLIPVVAGNIGLFWGLLAHSAQAGGRIDMEMAELSKPYLLKAELYRYSRNPMYVSELVLLFGWVVFYGSIAVLLWWLVWWAFFNFFAVPREERVMEASFGQAYREYKNEVPRWFGRR